MSVRTLEVFGYRMVSPFCSIVSSVQGNPKTIEEFSQNFKVKLIRFS